MQAIAIACSVLFAIVDFTQAQDDISNSLYTTRYERLNVDTILQSPRLVTNYVECLLNKKPCAPEGKALKRILPEALRTKCSRCHPSQKEVALKVITALYFDYPQHYKALREKWDPSGEYNKRFEEYLRDQKFNSIGGGEADQGEQAQGSSFSINVTQRPTRQGQESNQTQAQTPPPPPADTKPSATESDDKELPAILNRFGGDDEDGYDYTAPKPANETVVQATTVAPQQPARPQKPSQPAQPQPQQSQKPQQQPSAPAATSAPSRRPSNGNNSPSSGGSAKPSHNNNSPGGSHTWTHHNNHPAPSLSTTYYLQTQNPVLNIINRITLKFANTAEFIAGMLRGAVPQPQRS